MKSVLLLAFAVFIAVASAAGAGCVNFSCSDVGGTCVSTADTFYSCKAGTYCDGKVCQTQLNAGANCSGVIPGPNVDDPCQDKYLCMSGTCQMIQFSAGYLCTSDSQCYQTNSGGSRVASTCAAGRCAGLNAGDKCIVGAAQCGNGLYCGPISGSVFDGTCTANPVAGAYCNRTWNYCYDERSATDLRCSTEFSNSDGPKEGKCVAWFTQPLGANCTSFTDCQDGLVCQNYDYVADGFGTCAKPLATSSGKTCTLATDFTDCGALESCTCTTQSSTSAATCQKLQGLPSGSANVFNDATKCAANSYDCYYGTDKCSGSCYKSICSVIARENTLFSGSGVSALQTCSLSSADQSRLSKCLKATGASFFLAPAVAIVALVAFLL